MSTAAIRPCAVAGTWYPADPDALAHEVDRLLERRESPPAAGSGDLVGLVVPHAGYRYSGACAGAGFARARGLSPGRVAVLAPSHYGAFHGFSVPDYQAFRTPLGDVEVDEGACAALRSHPLAAARNEAHAREHAIELQLPFLQRAVGEFRLVPVLVGSADETELAEFASRLRAVLEAESLLVTSTDFTHYGEGFGYRPFEERIEEGLRRLDEGAIERLLRLDPGGLAAYQRETGITACGLRPMQLMLHALPAAARAERVEYYTSGHLTGDWDHCVSYAAVAFYRGAETARPEADRGALLARARRAIAQALGRAAGDPPAASPGGAPAGGLFVTLRDAAGELRGCIGTVEPGLSLDAAVSEYAVRSALEDPRFPPLAGRELDTITIEISVLHAPRDVADPAAIEPGRHGVILEKGRHRALFLPQVAVEQGWGREELLDHLAAKAGLPPDAWREGARLQVFTAESFAERPPGGAGGTGGRLPGSSS